ncbi:MAG: hypothetical protein U0X91_03080 [Spirosomataceae bacterium]
MKPLFVLALIVVLFSCKDKEAPQAEIPLVSPGLVGTYSKTFTVEDYHVFHNMFPERKIFQETVTVVITEVSKDNYQLQVTLFGTAKKDKLPDIHYGVTADLKQTPGYNFDGTPALMFRGNFANLVPDSPDFNGTQVESGIKIKDRSIEFYLAGSYKEDIGGFVFTDLPKIK